nr:major capsid subunit [Salmonid herpesvirus 1]
MTTFGAVAGRIPQSSINQSGHFGPAYSNGVPGGNFSATPTTDISYLTPDTINSIINHATVQSRDDMVRSLVGDFFTQGRVAGGSVSTSGGHGAGINFQDLQRTVIVPMLTISTGLLLNMAQNNNLEAFMRLISEEHVPEFIPNAEPLFQMVFKNVEQRIAQLGNLDTTTGGVSETVSVLTVNLESYALSININSKEINYLADPQVVIDAIIRELQSTDTAWGLTMLVQHVQYCVKQPSLSELFILQGALQNVDTNRGFILGVLQLESIICGSVNRKCGNLVGIIHAATQALRVDSRKCVVVLPDKVYQAARLGNVMVDYILSEKKKRFVYNTRNPVGDERIAQFGEYKPLNAPALAAAAQVVDIPPYQSGGCADNKMILPTAVGDTLKMRGIQMGMDSVVPMVVLDHQRWSPENDMSVEAAMAERGTKRLFITVGSVPEVYRSLATSSFFGTSATPGASSVKPGEIGPREVSLRSPRTSYLINQDDGGKADGVTLHHLHQIVNDNPDIWDIGQVADRVRGALSPEQIGEFLPDDSAAMVLWDDYNAKCANLQSVFEFSPRFRVTLERGIAQAGNGVITVAQEGPDGAGVLQHYNIVERLCMGNASPMNMWYGTHCPVASDMLLVAPKTDSLDSFYGMVIRALADAGGITDVLNLRAHPLNHILAYNDPVISQMVQTNGVYLPLSDPYCQLIIANSLSEIVRTVYVAPANPSAADLVVMQTILQELRGGISALTNVFHSLFDNVNFSLLNPGIMLRNIINTTRGTAAQNLWLNIGYMCLLPAISNKVIFVSAAAAAVVDQLCHYTNGLTTPSHQDAVFVGQNVPIPNDQTRNCWSTHLVPGNWADSVVGVLFQTAAGKIRTMYGNTNVHVGVLLMLHLFTRINRNTLVNHFDTKYYSGWSYVGIRTIDFVGHGIAVLPRQSAKFITGNRYAATVDNGARHQQVMAMVVAPGGLDKMGTYIPNVLCTNITGNGVNYDPNGAHPMIILDSHNGFLPEGKLTSGVMGTMQPLTGRYDLGTQANLTVVDPITGQFSVCPTFSPTLSDTTAAIVRRVEDGAPDIFTEDHPYVAYLEGVRRGAAFDTVPPFVADPNLAQPTNLLRRTVYSQAGIRNVFTSGLGMMFTDTYTIGENSANMLKADPGMFNVLHGLTPKIISENFTPCTLFNDKDRGFMLKFSRLTGLNLTMSTNLRQHAGNC